MMATPIIPMPAPMLANRLDVVMVTADSILAVGDRALKNVMMGMRKTPTIAPRLVACVAVAITSRQRFTRAAMMAMKTTPMVV